MAFPHIVKPICASFEGLFSAKEFFSSKMTRENIETRKLPSLSQITYSEQLRSCLESSYPRDVA